MSENFQPTLPNVNCFCHEAEEPIANSHNSQNPSHIEQPTTDEGNYRGYLDDEDLQEIQDEFEQFCNQLRNPQKLTQKKNPMEFLCEPEPGCPDGTPRCNLDYCEASIDDLDDQND